MRHTTPLRPAAIALAVVLVAASSPARAQHVHPAPSTTTPASTAEHGAPKDWKFTLPKGDAAKGREVFARLECYRCHEVLGERFPAPSAGDAVGPELSQMGPMHPPEFFAESIVNPGAFVEPRYRAADGSSRMPSFNDSMTVQELIDVVAFLAGLEPPTNAPASHQH
jgi:sulfur-oxidizing protein SoxX